jgi:ribosome biogenesis GTPase
MQTPPEKHESSGQPGLVISYFGNSVAVEADNGQVFQCHLRRNQELPVVGDRVRWRLEADNTGLILDIEPRRSVLTRGQGHGKMKPVAANLDVLVLVMAPQPNFSEYLADRYLVAAEILNLQAVLVLNKSDLLDNDSRLAASARLDIYRRIPYPVVLTSIFDPESLKRLDAELAGRTAVLVGPSGVGKSSIITALGSDESIRVGGVSNKGSGKHTTTATRLYHLPQGGHLIDSPGVREFNLWPVTRQEVLKGFPEFQPFLHGCKFRNCQHRVEPGCAVQAALADGKISPQRFNSYHELMKEADENNKNSSGPKKGGRDFTRSR